MKIKTSHKDSSSHLLNSPSAFCINKNKVKVFVLGADPSNFSDNGKTKQLNKVFGIGDGDARYFAGILRNLKEIGLDLEGIYVQNMISLYMDEETSKNKNWENIAEGFVKSRIHEFNKIDKSRKIPVLVTAEKIYKFLLAEEVNPQSATSFYTCESTIPIDSEKNKLGRPLIPFYRHPKYELKKWKDYKNKIIKLIG